MAARRAQGKALEAAKELYHHRSRRVEELKREGHKIMGYFCCYAPLEFITAAGMVPYRIMGNAKEPTTVADAYLDTTFCPYVRSCFDIAMKGSYHFLDGIVWPTSCDNLINVSAIWNYNMKAPYFYQISVPKVADSLAIGFFTWDLGRFRQSLASFARADISDNELNSAIQLHNQSRALLRELYELRRPDPPLLRGSEVCQILVDMMSLPVAEANELVEDVIAEARESHYGPQKKPARLLMSGNELDDSSLIETIEDCGANVVADDLCIGSRFFLKDVEIGGDPVAALAKHYLGDIMCPRTFRGGPDISREQELKLRFGHIMDFARDFGVNGAILYILKYCDSQEWDAPDLRDYLQDNGLPVLHLEHDYSTVALAPFRTRVQAFVEMVS